MSLFSMEKDKTRDTFKNFQYKKTSKIAFYSKLSWSFYVAFGYVSSTSFLHVMKFPYLSYYFYIFLLLSQFYATDAFVYSDHDMINGICFDVFRVRTLIIEFLNDVF